MMMMIDNVITADMMREACAQSMEQERQRKEVASIKAKVYAGEMATWLFNTLREIAKDGESYWAQVGYLTLTFAKRKQGKADCWTAEGLTLYCPSRVNGVADYEARFYWTTIRDILQAAGFKGELWTDYSAGYWKDCEVRISWGV